jgi:Trypsin-like peptidase domain
MHSSVTIQEYSLATIRFSAKRGEIEHPATGFLLRYGENFYLVTALHVLTGRHWQTKQLLSASGFIPAEFTLMIPHYRQPAPRSHQLNWFLHRIEPMKPVDGADEEVAPWLVHPDHKEDVDVALMPLGDLPQRILSQAVARGVADLGSPLFSFDGLSPPRLSTSVADDVFVIGFPENIKTAGELPVWKRGSVATEPDLPINDLPYCLVDTGTRGGMSGSPVVRRAPAGLVPSGPGSFALNQSAHIELFGIYTSRFGADDLTSQLGIVWHRKVIAEILAKPTLGRSSLCTRLWC